MRYVGVDLTSAYSRVPRSIDIALVDDGLNCTFAQAMWPASPLVERRDPGLFGMLLRAVGGSPNDVIWAVDGPQGLARAGKQMRLCEQVLGTPGRTPAALPATDSTRPFETYIRSSIDLFAVLHPELRLAGMPRPDLGLPHGVPLETATLFEIFPGAEWAVLAGRRLSKKTSRAGRQERRDLFAAMGVLGLPPLPTADQNDALVGAYLAWCTRRQGAAVRLEGEPPSTGQVDLVEGAILHATAAARVPVPVAIAASPLVEQDPVGVSDDEWSGDGDLLIRLNDTGLVHGTDPENAWLLEVTARGFETVAPFPIVRFELYPSKQVGSWRVRPTIPALLTQIGIDQPIISEKKAVTLRVRIPTSNEDQLLQ